MKPPSTHPPISPKVKGLYIGVQAVLALYAQWVWSQKLRGDWGDWGDR